MHSNFRILGIQHLSRVQTESDAEIICFGRYMHNSSINRVKLVFKLTLLNFPKTPSSQKQKSRV